MSHLDKPIYTLLSSQGLAPPTDPNDLDFQSRLAFELERRQLTSDTSEGFANMALGVLKAHPRFSQMSRVCVARVVGQMRRLEVVDSVCEGNRVANTMPKGYGCFISNASTLLTLEAAHQRLFSDSTHILESFKEAGKPSQRSIRRLHTAGLRSGLCLPLSASGRIAGFLFVNASEAGVFDGLTIAQVQPILLLRRVSESYLLQSASLPDAAYRSHFGAQVSLSHGLYDAPSFRIALASAFATAFDSPPDVRVSSEAGLRFLHSEDNSAYAVARLVQGVWGISHPPRRIGVRVSRRGQAVRFAVESISSDEPVVFESSQAVSPSHPLAGVANMFGFGLSMTASGFALDMDYDEPEGSVDYSC